MDEKRVNKILLEYIKLAEKSNKDVEILFHPGYIDGNEVDFIVSHCCAASTQALIGGGKYKRDYLNEYLEKIRQSAKFKKWFFGHYHNNKNVNMKNCKFR